jgi:23S rRNA pseudouridine2457 synthase
MTAAVGHPTLRLVRIEIGAFSDPLLVPGTWRNLDDEEIKRAKVAGTR